MSRSSFENLWLSAPPAEKYFDPAQVSELPEAARRYLSHSIAGGTPLASAGRLRMHGEIKLKGWNKFSAEQIIRWGRGMIWRATVRMHGISIRGGDCRYKKVECVENRETRQRSFMNCALLLHDVDCQAIGIRITRV